MLSSEEGLEHNFYFSSAKMTNFTFTLWRLSNTFTELVGPKWEEEISSSALPKTEILEKGVFLHSGRVFSIRKSDRQNQNGLDNHIVTGQLKIVL